MQKTCGTVRNMPKIKIVQIIAVLLILFSVANIIITFVVKNHFLGKFDQDNASGEERLKVRMQIFQKHMISLSLFSALIGMLIFIFSENTAKFIKRKKKIFMNISVFLVVLIVSFFILEAILRVFYSEQIYDEFGFGPGEPYHYKRINLNSLGFRDVEHSIEKDNNIYRIIVIGDSFTFGWGIKNSDDIYSSVLQKKLDDKYGKGKFEVINLAKNGYSTADVVNVIRDTGLKFNPDLIIYGYYPNDAEGPNSLKGFEKLYFHHFLRPYEAGYFLYQNSFAYYFLESRLKNVIQQLGFEGKTYQDYITHLYSDSNPFFKEHKAYLEDFINIGKKENISVIIMNFPVITDFSNYPFSFINGYIENVTLSNDAIYIDLLDSFSQYNANNLKVSFLDAHINELGHNITADAILNQIQVDDLTK